MTEKRQYDIKMEDRDGYLYVVVGGDRLTAPISALYWNEIAEHCMANRCMRILIVKEFVESVGPQDMLQMAMNLGNLLPHRRIAFIDRYGHDDINELGKRLARNREVVMRIFEGTAAAEHWLLAN